jgi:hypothetical protein
VLIASDSHIYNNNGYYYNDNTITTKQAVGAVLVSVGMLSSLGSIPLFVVSRVMYKKAMSASAFLGVEKTPPSRISGIPIQPFPALGLKVSL